MRRSIVFAVALILGLVFSVQSGARQPMPGSNPQYRTNDPRFQRPDTMRGDRRTFVGQLSVDLVRQAEYLAQTSYEYFMGWNGLITDKEQAVLFKTEEFAAACRLFSKLVQDRTDYFRRDSVRTNLFNASHYVAAAFRWIEEEMRTGGMQTNYYRMRRDGRPFNRPQDNPNIGPFGLAECRRLLDRIEQEFASWRF